MTHLAHLRSRRAARRKGFTLIELVLVLTIISFLAAAAIYMLMGNVEVAQETRAEQDIQAINTQMKMYVARNLRPPTSDQGIKALVEKPEIEPLPERWTQLLEEIPKDPWDREYQYEAPARRSKRQYDIFSLGPDGVESEDDIGNWKKSSKNKS